LLSIRLWDKVINGLICSIVKDEIQDEQCISISVCRHTYFGDDGGGDNNYLVDDNTHDEKCCSVALSLQFFLRKCSIIWRYRQF